MINGGEKSPKYELNIDWCATENPDENPGNFVNTKAIAMRAK